MKREAENEDRPTKRIKTLENEYSRHQGIDARNLKVKEAGSNNPQTGENWYSAPELRSLPGLKLQENPTSFVYAESSLRSSAPARRAQHRDSSRSGARAGNAVDPEYNYRLFSDVNRVEQTPVYTPNRGVQNSSATQIQVTQPISLAYGYAKPLEAGQLVNVTGVVVDARKPSKTTSGEWSCRLKIIDPTVSDSTALYINCFSKKYMEWLPVPDKDDIVMLRNIKTLEFEGTVTGIGYNDRLQWAIFSSSIGQMHHGNRGSAPESEVLAGGMGVTYTPFYTYGVEDTRECLRLSNLWRTEKKKRDSQVERGLVQQFGSSTPSSTLKKGREHLLICDAGPEVQPAGYFDSTVEVLSAHVNSNSSYTVYVTDYTANAGCLGLTIPVHWCPSGLEAYVLKIILWDDAARFGPTLQRNGYYTMKNLRMIKKEGSFEAKAFEGDKKIYPAVLGCPNLRALLDRKDQWELNNDASGSLAEVPDI
ncbi:hypothetical protein BDN72DRAFT_965560 [Pluteus cervinus]|uniref:Uncharacterized protein n=1 Tax=Pluteus cervinus TaxID=181527 RepID=A0ACD3A577_9AGAR|nr:hypothetical protein BDN72DRAFT_965560 [Pluteus cervinus]